MSVEGMLAAVLSAKRLGLDRLYMPYDEKLPFLDINDLEIIYTNSLKEVLESLEGKGGLRFTPKTEEFETLDNNYIKFQQIIGHSTTKRAMEVAAAG